MSKYGSRVLPKDSLTAYERWEMPSVEDPKPAEEVEPEIVPLTAEQIEEIQQQAYEEGLELGRQEGLKNGEAEIRAQAERFDLLMRALARPFEDLDERVEQELTSLAITVARQVIRRELKIDPGQVVAVVREAMAALPAAARDVRVALHPEDAALVRQALAMGDDGERAWKITEDPVLTRGDCKVYAEHSFIDATVEKRLAAIVVDLLGIDEREHDGTEPT